MARNAKKKRVSRRLGLADLTADERESFRIELFKAVPQKQMRFLLGCAAVQLQDFASRYGLPVAGRIADLREVLGHVRDLCAAMGRRRVSVARQSGKWAIVLPDEDPLLTASDSPNAERYRAAKADLAEMDVQKRRGELIERTDVQAAWTAAAALLQRAAHQLQRRFGADAQVVLHDAVQGIEQRISTVLTRESPEDVAEPAVDPQDGDA